MSAIERLARFSRKPLADQWSAIKATFLQADAVAQRRRQRMLTGQHVPPAVLLSDERLYVAYRPDADRIYNAHPEIAELAEKWIANNVSNNVGDLPRLYALILNIKQVLGDRIEGDIAELGVYRGNSAAVLAHYGRIHGRKVHLFDTFEGFDNRDFVGPDSARTVEFTDTSLEAVRGLVGETGVSYLKGRFPASIPPELYDSRFCLAHIDCDLYEPAKAGLAFFYPRLSPGGLIILHDYANPNWDGIKRAVDEFCLGIPDRPVILADKSGTAMIRKSFGGATV